MSNLFSCFFALASDFGPANQSQETLHSGGLAQSQETLRSGIKSFKIQNFPLASK